MNNDFEKSSADMNAFNIQNTPDGTDQEPISALKPLSVSDGTAPVDPENPMCMPEEQNGSSPEDASSGTPSAVYTSPNADISASEDTNVFEEAVPEATLASVSKKSQGAKGFKVFAACMLAVFTVSAAAIAGLMAADYIDSRKAPVSSSNGTSKDNTSYEVSGNTLALLSTFKDTEGALTKSQVAAKCSPSAVGIVVEVETASGYYGGWFGNFYSQPQITQGAGSGFVYTSDGYIITNHHVVEGASKITVYFNDKTQAEATLIGSDALSDIAVIKVDPEGLDLIPMEIGNSDELVVGDEVIAIGCPAGIEYMGTVTDGIISAINRDVELTESGKTSKKTMTLLQTNATINRGNSGGPLINSRGQVIGINTLKLGADYEGIGFSIPMNGAKPIISQLIEFGEVKERSENDFVSGEGVIGISGSNITEYEAKYYDIPRGVLVVQIDKDSSAAAAGLRRGDIITAYNGKTVQTVEELNTFKAANKAGDQVTLTVYRDADDETPEETFELTFKLDIA